MKSVSLTLAAVLAVASATASAELRIAFTSTPGDVIGGGQSFDQTYADDDANLTIGGSSGAFMLSHWSEPTWQLGVRAPDMQPLAPACYERAAASDGIRSWLQFGFQTHGCSSPEARFKVLDYAYDEASQTLSSLAIDFVQQCGGPPLFGKVRYNTDIPFDTPSLEPVWETIGEFHYTSDPGDFVGDAGAERYTLDSGVFGAHNAEGGFSAVYYGTEGGYWDLDLAGPDHTALAPGTYAYAERYPFQSPGHAGLSYGMNGRACNSLDGQFTIASIAADPIDGGPVEFKVEFEQYCREGIGGLHGYLGFQTIYRNGPLVADELFLDSFDGATPWPLVWSCPLDAR